jgi:amino acid adenylation domain-containing protein
VEDLLFTRYEPDPESDVHAQQDITFWAVEEEGSIRIDLEYCTALFKQETMERFFNHFITLLKGAAANPGLTLPEIEMMSPEEKYQVLTEFNDTRTPFPGGKVIHELFEDQAERTPDKIAAVGTGYGAGKELLSEFSMLTYRELNERADRLAYVLIEKGVHPDTIVGIMVDPSIEMIIGILGILKAGGVYLPLDPDYPQERIDFMLKDSSAKVLVRMVGNRLACSTAFEPSPSPSSSTSACQVSSANLAYIIYTSGTTGRPKGVMVDHRNMAAYLYAFYREFGIHGGHTVLQLASYTFDAFIEEIFPVLLKGGKIVIPGPDERMDILLLSRLIIHHGVNFIDCTPLLLNEFNKIEGPGSFDIIISGGDVLKGEYVDRLLKVGRVYNTYGPTESTVCAAYYRYTGGLKSSIPIGKPISNYTVYILNKNRQLQPIGVVGELCVGGAGVTRGYLNRPELTAEKFIYWSYRTDRTYSSNKVYKTGDLARWLPDGNIEFLGRIDFQVKIRGFRIELGEVENRLLHHHAVKKAVVCAREDSSGEKCLCAYLVADQGIEVPGIREYLLKELPDYMIPAYFVQLDKVPLTPGGKVDRNALPAPEIGRCEIYIAPRDEMEMTLVKLWSSIIGLEGHIIGIDDDFFQLGGHSLRAALVTAEIHKRFDVCLSLSEFFEIPTVRGLAEYIKKADRNKFLSIKAAETREYYVLSPTQKSFYFLYQLNPRSTAYNIFGAFMFEEKVDTKRLENAFRALIHRHENLRTSFIMVDQEEDPVQKIQQKVKFEIEQYNAKGTVQSAEPGTASFIKRFVRPFDLLQPPLLRVGLSQVEEEKYLFLIDIHHIISDAISIETLVEEFMMIYVGREENLAELELQYKDFSQWQNSLIESGEMKRQEEYWLKQFSGEVPVLDIPTDYERPAIQNFEGDNIRFEISRQQVMKLREYAREEDTTVFTVLLAVFYILLSKLSGQEDIVVGTPTAGRRHSDLYRIIGVFINTLALRNYPGADKRFDEFLREVRQRTLEAFDHQDYPFEDLVKKVQEEWDSQRNPLFDALYNYQWHNNNLLWAADETAAKSPFPNLKKYNLQYNKAFTDLILNVVEVDSNEHFFFYFAYCTKLFKRETAEEFVEYFKELVSAVVENKRVPLKEIKISHDLGVIKPKAPQITFGF